LRGIGGASSGSIASSVAIGSSGWSSARGRDGETRVACIEIFLVGFLRLGVVVVSSSCSIGCSSTGTSSRILNCFSEDSLAVSFSASGD